MSYMSSEELKSLLRQCPQEIFTMAASDALYKLQANARDLAREVIRLRQEKEDWKLKSCQISRRLETNEENP